MALRRPVPAGAAEPGHAHRVRRAQARPQARSRYPHPDLEDDPQGHVRDHGLPGAGHADRRARWPATRWARPTTCARSWARRTASRSAPQREKFVAGCRRRGVTRAPVGRGAVRLIEPFADYGFNASHACAYGYVAYQTAYLKAHHPVEYMSAMLTQRQGRQGPQALLPERVPRRWASRCCRPT